ncbi:hypothetical protein OI18_11855 [Flavihumibacter solisilvae]|uniref:PKD/Chitinase domain-containing protein n=1 Tax=Flavihumibacter solisilvae TaxID=1349421 RepID=A0A0C1IUZ0_9BACT|nr:hypothetical protein OI18_11855 [Flavihumibacter solisilvae]
MACGNGFHKLHGQSNILHYADFESTTNLMHSWDNVENCCSYSLTRSTAFKRTGSSSLRIELNRTDPDVAGNKRVELTDNSYPVPLDSTRRWWAFSNFLPADFQYDPVRESFAQWHFKPQGTVSNGTPPLSLVMNKGNWTIVLSYDSIDINIDGGKNIKTLTFDLGPWQRGVWNDWVFNYNYTADNTGYLKIWKNGQVVLDYKGKCWYKGGGEPIFKVGLYKWVWAPSWTYAHEQSTTTKRVYYLDNVKVGNFDADLNDFLITPANSSNVLPLVVVGPKQTLTLPTNNSTLSGVGSHDPDGTAISYLWEQVSGPSVATLSANNTSRIIASNMVAGLYQYQLTITDADGAKAAAVMEVEIRGTAQNTPPVANPGVKKYVQLPNSTTILYGDRSTDKDGLVASYSWTQYSGPTTATMTSPTAANIQLSNLNQGNYFFKLTVKDNKGGMNSKFINVLVLPGASAPNIAPVADAGWNQTLTLPMNAATLRGTQSTDADGSIVKYQWQQLSGPSVAPMASPTASANVISNLIQGTYTFRLTVTDNAGATATASVNIIILAAPTPPPATGNQAPVADASWNQTLYWPVDNATLNGTGSYDSDGSISTYRWTQKSGPATATMTGATSSKAIVRDLLIGSYIFELAVTDNLGARATTTMTVNVVNTTTATTSMAQVGGSGELMAAQTVTIAPVDETAVSVFPNPAHDHIRIRVIDKGQQPEGISIYSSGDQLIFSDKISPGTQVYDKRVDMSKYPAGTYYLKINNRQSQPVIRKIVKT